MRDPLCLVSSQWVDRASGRVDRSAQVGLALEETVAQEEWADPVTASIAVIVATAETETALNRENAG